MQFGLDQPLFSLYKWPNSLAHYTVDLLLQGLEPFNNRGGICSEPFERCARDWREEKAANLLWTNTHGSSSSHWLTVKLRTKLISMTAAGNFIPQKTEKVQWVGWSLITGWYCAIVRWLTVKTFACESVDQRRSARATGLICIIFQIYFTRYTCN